jgi:hypothetical protein
MTELLFSLIFPPHPFKKIPGRKRQDMGSVLCLFYKFVYFFEKCFIQKGGSDETKRFHFVFIFRFLMVGCSTAYQVKPMAFKMPSSYHNVTAIGNAQVAAKAFTDKTEAMEAFGFDILGAGMLPVQVIFDNQGIYSLEINGSQTFLEDQDGNLWPILSSQVRL